MTIGKIHRLGEYHYLSRSDADSFHTNDPYGYAMGERPYVVRIEAFGWIAYAADATPTLVARRAIQHLRYLHSVSGKKSRLPRKTITRMRKRLLKQARQIMV